MAKRPRRGEPLIHLDQIVADAVADYAKSSFKTRERRFRALAAGVTRRAHSWCVDIRGSAKDLVAAGAPAAWFAGREQCMELHVGGRRIEIWRGEPSTIEVSVRYSDAEMDQIAEARE